MENNNKTQAEIYRAERKERLAKAAAKNAKRSPKSVKTKKLVKKVVSIVLVVAIAIGAVAGVLNFFDVPEKAVKVSVDGVEAKISLAEINYYYYQSWYSFYSYAQQYDQYGAGMGLQMTGYDSSKTPDSQEYTEQSAQVAGIPLEDLGENPTWEDAFTYSAISQVVYAKYGAAKAEEAGIELDKDELEEIDTQIDSVRQTAKQNDYSLDRWLRLNFGAGVTEKVIYDATVESSLASKYYEKVTNDTKDSVTDEEINDKYNSAKDDYDIVDIRIYAFSAQLTTDDKEDLTEDEIKAKEEEAKANAKNDAEKIFADVKDEKEFIAAAQSAILTADEKSDDKAEEVTLVEKTSFAELSTSYGEEIAKWVYDDARKVSDITTIADESGNQFVVFMKALPKKDTSASSSDVRHILVEFPDQNTDGSDTTKTDAAGNQTSNITDDTKKVTKEKAQKILDEYLENPTEDNFAELAKKKTDDPGSKETGGLYEEVSDNGQYVEEFTNWAVDAARKPGDTGIVETSYGYHIMYYVEANAESWYATIQADLTNEKLQSTVQDVIDGYVDSFNRDSFLVNWTIGKQNKHIGKIVISNN